MDDYIRELEDIKQGSDDAYKSDEDITKPPNEEERGLLTLQTIGLDDLAEKFENGLVIGLEESSENAFFTTNRRYNRLLNQQISTLNAATVRKKQRTVHRDVRDVFAGVPEFNKSTSAVATTKRGSMAALIKRSISFGGMDRERTARSKSLYKNFHYVRRKSTNSPISSSESLDDITNSEFTFEPVNRRVSADVECDGVIHSTDASLGNGTATKSDFLPEYQLRCIPAGITSVEDLSKEDVSHIAKLAFFELMENSVNLYPVKSKKKPKEATAVFGVDLDSLVESDSNRPPKDIDVKVPLFFAKLIDHLKNTSLDLEGILRVSGSIAKIKTIAADLDDNYPSHDLSSLDPLEATGLLKKFLRELPTPLLRWDFVEVYQPLLRIPSMERKLFALQCLILNIPESYRNTLKVLLSFLRQVILHEATNRMSLCNVATILAPNLFPSRKQRGFTPELAEGMADVVTLLINYQEIIWTIPLDLIETLRKDTDRKKAKVHERSGLEQGDAIVMMKFKIKKDNKYNVQKASENDNHGASNVIHVQAPDFTKSSVRVPLSLNFTALDVVEAFMKKKEVILKERKMVGVETNSTPEAANFSPQFVRLYEVGGNIGGRCLQPGANILAVLHANPLAEWRIWKVPDYSCYQRMLTALSS